MSCLSPALMSLQCLQLPLLPEGTEGEVCRALLTDLSENYTVAILEVSFVLLNLLLVTLMLRAQLQSGPSWAH